MGSEEITGLIKNLKETYAQLIINTMENFSSIKKSKRDE